MKRLLSSLTLLLSGLVGSQAAAQSEGQNSVVIKQLGGGDVRVVQKGKNNSVLIDQNGGLGDSSDADYQQKIMNDARISQYGRANAAAASQYNGQNKLQQGVEGENTSSVTQEGDNNYASQTQTGKKNHMEFHQKGEKNQAVHHQTGPNNTLIKEQNNEIIVDHTITEEPSSFSPSYNPSGN